MFKHRWSWISLTRRFGDPKVQRVTGEEEGLMGEQPASLFKSAAGSSKPSTALIV